MHTPLQCMPLPCMPPATHASTCGQTDVCENITLPQSSFTGSNNRSGLKIATCKQTLADHYTSALYLYVLGRSLEAELTVGFSNPQISTRQPETITGQPIDPVTGLVYQRVPCSEKDGLFATITTPDSDTETQYEIFIQVNGFPTAEQYVYYRTMEATPIGSGLSEVRVVLTKKDFRLPVDNGYCCIGAKVFHHESKNFMTIFHEIQSNLICEATLNHVTKISSSKYIQVYECVLSIKEYVSK